MKKVWIVAAALLLIFGLAACTQQEVDTQAEEPQSEVTAPEAPEEIGTGSLETDDMKKMLTDENVVLVDTRSTHAFNGWKMGEEARGGHIEGATVFSATWLDKLASDEAVQAELDRYGITADKHIVTYGYGAETASLVAEKLTALGYENVSVYSGGIEAWAADESLPMASMAHYELLVPASWVQEHMNDNNVKVFEASWGPGDNYKKAHIPGAAHINTDDFEEGPLWNRKSDAELEQAALKNGIQSDMTIVLYGDDITASARIATILKYMGVEDVRLLNGGFTAWKDAGYQVAEGGVEARPVDDFGVAVPQHPDYIIDMEEAKTLLASDEGKLVSIRSWVEYIGETSGYDYIEAAGRIDGAVYGFAGSDPWHMEDYRTPANTMINYELIAKRWVEQGIQPTEPNAFYCGTGWRASETWFYAHAMGWDNIAVYDGGWKEWSEAGQPTATGVPKK